MKKWWTRHKKLTKRMKTVSPKTFLFSLSPILYISNPWKMAQFCQKLKTRIKIMKNLLTQWYSCREISSFQIAFLFLFSPPLKFVFFFFCSLEHKMRRVYKSETHDTAINCTFVSDLVFDVENRTKNSSATNQIEIQVGFHPI